MKKILVFIISLFTIHHSLFSQEIYPANWWVGMKHNTLQLMLHGKDVATTNRFAINYAGVKLIKVNKVESKNYVFLDVSIADNAKPGVVKINVGDAAIDFTLNKRREGRGTAFAQGVTASDFIYFLMPDRFSNGDVSNDKVAGMRDQSLNRDSMYHRHGGDLQGIVNHLDYIKNLGATTLWLTPVLENDMPNRTEHGYAFTNHYKIEPRFGGDAAYKKLSNELHSRGMKLIQDAVYNHVGSYHFTITDPPMKDWLHQWDTFTQTSYKDQPLFDTHGSAKEKKRTADGWFTKQMPDLNQGNAYVANFLIQHAIWCVEEFGVDGWRIDTYIYNDLPFMNKCNDALIKEYPKMTMFGENWVHGTAAQAYFCDNNINTSFKSNLQGSVDFQTLFYGITPALNDKFGWTDGVNKLYTTLSNDFLYKDPMRNCIMLDNHDMTRFLSTVNGDVAKLKMGLAWLLTCRGIPQLYYGTEVLMKGVSNPDGLVRADFYGGWEGDAKNAFTGQGLTDEEKAVQDYTKTLANFRKKSSAIKTGKLMQFVPQDGVYVYFRYDANQTVMCVMNTNETEASISLDRFSERTNGFTKAYDVATGATFNIEKTHKIGGKYVWVLELKK